MTERHELRWGGFAGLAFVVLALLGKFLPGNPPTVDALEGTITGFLIDARTSMLIGALMWTAAAGLIIWFAAAFAEAIRERDERSDVHLALLAGSVLVGAAIFVTAGLTAATAFSIDGRGAAITVMLYELTAVMTTMIGFAATLPLAAAGIGVLRTQLMPNWLGLPGPAGRRGVVRRRLRRVRVGRRVRCRRHLDDHGPAAGVGGLDRLRRRLHGARAPAGGDSGRGHRPADLSPAGLTNVLRGGAPDPSRRALPSAS